MPAAYAVAGSSGTADLTPVSFKIKRTSLLLEE